MERIFFMNISFVSKNILLTQGLESFVTKHIQKLQKISAQKLRQLQVILDVQTHKKAGTQSSVIELVGDMEGKKVVVRESGKTFYQAFFGAVKKMKSRLSRKKQ